MTLSPGPDFETLFDPHFLSRVGEMTLRIAAAQKGGRLAEQRTLARGQGSDFADFKPYVAGDDLRAIDWNIYRRLAKPFVRVFEERQDLPVYFLLDASHSMFLENPPRILPAMQAVLALAAIAAAQHDAVNLLSFGDTVTPRLRNVSGKGAAMRVASALAEQDPAGKTELSAAIAELSAIRLRRGLTVIVSDFFDNGGIGNVLRALDTLEHRILLIQLVRESDADPTLLADFSGDFDVEDGESDTATQISVTPDLLDRYRAAYGDFTARIDEYVKGRGTTLIRIDADGDVIDQLAATLVGAGPLP